MTALDGLVLLLVGGGALRGAYRGFTYEIVSLLAWIVGILALRFFFASVAGWLAESGVSPALSAILAFLLLFGGPVTVLRFVGRRVGSGIRSSVVGPVDRVLGAGFGALKGLVAVTLLFLLANLLTGIAYGEDRPGWITEARSFALLNASGRAIVDFVEWRTGEGNEAPGRR